MAIESFVDGFKPVYEVDRDKTDTAFVLVACLRCGRPLTNEKSRSAHLGPRCARKLAYETRTHSFSSKTLQHHTVLVRTSHGDEVPTQDISLYYSSSSSTKPYCKIGTVILPAIDVCISNSHNYRKITYSFPLFEEVIYEILVPLPQARIFWLQVQDQRLKDVSNTLTFGST